MGICWRRRRAATVTVVVVATAALAGAATAPASKARKQHCQAIAHTPVVFTSTRTGYAAGSNYSDCISSWAYTVRLKNNAGNTLREDSGNHDGSHLVTTATVSCVGAIVHTFFYTNAGGAGSSDTSGTNSDCAY
jgi:hypothetical protein